MLSNYISPCDLIMLLLSYLLFLIWNLTPLPTKFQILFLCLCFCPHILLSFLTLGMGQKSLKWCRWDLKRKRCILNLAQVCTCVCVLACTHTHTYTTSLQKLGFYMAYILDYFTDLFRWWVGRILVLFSMNQLAEK